MNDLKELSLQEMVEIEGGGFLLGIFISCAIVACAAALFTPMEKKSKPC